MFSEEGEELLTNLRSPELRGLPGHDPLKELLKRADNIRLSIGLKPSRGLSEKEGTELEPFRSQ